MSGQVPDNASALSNARTSAHVSDDSTLSLNLAPSTLPLTPDTHKRPPPGASVRTAKEATSAKWDCGTDAGPQAQGLSRPRTPQPALEGFAFFSAQLQKRNRSSQRHRHLPFALDAGKPKLIQRIYDSQH